MGLKGWLGLQGPDKEMGIPAGVAGTSVRLWVLGDSHTPWGDRGSSQKCRERKIPMPGINQVLPGGHPCSPAPGNFAKGSESPSCG